MHYVCITYALRMHACMMMKEKYDDMMVWWYLQMYIYTCSVLVLRSRESRPVLSWFWLWKIIKRGGFFILVLKGFSFETIDQKGVLICPHFPLLQSTSLLPPLAEIYFFCLILGALGIKDKDLWRNKQLSTHHAPQRNHNDILVHHIKNI